MSEDTQRVAIADRNRSQIKEVINRNTGHVVSGLIGYAVAHYGLEASSALLAATP